MPPSCPAPVAPDPLSYWKVPMSRHADDPVVDTHLDALHSANDLLRARLKNRISRRGLLERAGELGLSARVAAIVLGATGDCARAAGRPVSAEKRLVPAKGKAIRGGSVTAGVVGAIETLNPYTCDLYGPAFDVLSGVMEGLVAFDSKLRIRPSLAERYEVSDDGLVYTFHLRPGVTFHNGDPLTGADVVASWQMLVNRELPVYSRLGWDRIASIEVPDPATVVVTTDQLFAPFLSSIAAGRLNGGAICPARFLGTAFDFTTRFDRAPVGTGPYRLKSFGRGEATLERYDKHWAGPPKLDRIAVRPFADDAALLAALAAGEIQVASRTGVPGANNLGTALAIPDATVLEYVGQTWGHLDLKQVGPLRETLVRQALDYATPRDRIIDEILGGEAVRAVADQTPAGPWANPAIKARPYDVEKAGRLLRRAGFAPGDDGIMARGAERLKVDLWGDAAAPDTRAVLRLLARTWGGLGVETTVNEADAATLYGPAGYQFTDRPTAGYYRWANVNDPDDLFYWGSSQIPATPDAPGGNLAAYFNRYAFQDAIDALTGRGAAETDPALRRQIYREVQALLHEEAPALFLFWDKAYAAAAETVGGWWPSAFTYLLWDAREWYVTG